MAFPQSAVNQLLRVIGLTTVNRVDLTDPATFDAHAKLTEVDKRLQEQGYWFNTDYTYTLNLDSNGNLLVPKEQIEITFSENRYIVRNGKVYDREDQTLIFTEDMEVPRIVKLMDYTETPEVYKQALLASAKLEHWIDNDDGSAKTKLLQIQEEKTGFRLKQEDLQKKQVSALNTTYCARLLGGMSYNPIAGQFGKVLGGPQWLRSQ